MIFPSHPPPVPLFHSLGNGTVEQTSHQWNSPRNISRTCPLKALANKVLEQNKKGNALGTRASKPVPPLSPNSIACGTKGLLSVSRPIHHATLHETKNGSLLEHISLHPSSVLEDYEERLAIAGYDGHQTSTQAERIAYLGGNQDMSRTNGSSKQNRIWP